MAKENKIYVIATIASKGKVFGVRITDLGDRRKKFMDVSIKDLMNVYKSTPNMFKNIAIVNGKLSTLGSNFTVVDFETKKPLVKPLIIVANRLGNLGYTLIDYNGNVKKCNIADTMKIAQTSAFGNAVASNGILIPTGADFITEAVAIKKDSGLESIGAGLMMDASKKIVGSYRADALNSVGEANIFDGLSDNQIQAIQNYYLWYTSEEYAKLSHNRTFEIKESKGIKLDSIRQDYVWYFGGIVDRGFKGNSKCTLGHPIRYEYIALGYESIKDRETDPKSFKNRVKFGETCSSDFFIIPLDEMRKLVKIRKAMSEEIEAIASAKKKQVYENDDKDWKALWENVELIRNLVDGKNIMQLTKAFGGKVANALMTFRDLDIPFPDSLVNLACNSAYGTEEKMVKPNKARDFWKVIITKELKPLIDWIFDYNKDSYIGDLASCLEFMCCYGLAGNYKYDPLNNTGRRFGPMNKRTRYLRYCMIVPYRKIGVYKFSYTELVNNVKYFSENVIPAEKEDFGLILMENRPEWIYTYFALWDRKAIPIALDSTSSSKEILYVLGDSNPKFIICSNESEKNVREAVSMYEKGEITVINVDNHPIDENKLEVIRNSNFELENPEGDSIATMLYTSGTTGSPKGVMLTFNNLSSELEGLEKKDLLEPTDQILALLPFHHVLPLTATVLIILQHQASMVFVKKIASKEILEALDKNNVTALVGVPRVFKLFYDGIKQQIDSKFITRTIYKLMTKVKSFKIRRKVFAKVHEKFGGELTFIVSGGAKLDPEIGEFYETLGIYVQEGYAPDNKSHLPRS